MPSWLRRCERDMWRRPRIHNYSNRRGSFRISGNVPTNDRGRSHNRALLSAARLGGRSSAPDLPTRASGTPPHPPAPPEAESKNVSPLTEKTVGERTSVSWLFHGCSKSYFQ